ncbi:MAG TPA: DUF6622 family protein [Ramlibacter sp.]|nr:DUF6622 family protein [Ramlibacter sp.]
MQLTPLIAVHATAALLALVTGPVALWARRGGAHRPRLHRAFGYAWVTLMVVTAVSAFFIRGGNLPNIDGLGPVHLLIPMVFLGLFRAFQHLARGNIRGHRKLMLILYFSACVGAGVFTLLPGRLLGELIWVEWLGLLAPHVHPVSVSTFEGPSMLVQILTNTPVWVWGLLAALLVLGFSQARARTASVARIALLPLGLGAFSLWGTISAFGASPAVLGSWAAATIALLLIVTQMTLPAGVRYDSARRQFALPGSWVPLVLILGIFITKYAVGVSLVMRPELRLDGTFTLAIATLYGVFSGIFAGRTVRLLRLALRPGAPAELQTAQA